jgi:hypothetical protein
VAEIERIKPSIDPNFFKTDFGMEAINAAIELSAVDHLVGAGRCSYITKIESAQEAWRATACMNAAEVYIVYNKTVRSFCTSCYMEKYVHKGETVITREEAIVRLIMQA